MKKIKKIKYIDAPLTLEEVRKRAKNGRLQVVVPIDFDEVVEMNGIEDFDDKLEKAILGNNGCLEDISWDVVGCLPNSGEILLRVTTSVENYLEENDE